MEIVEMNETSLVKPILKWAGGKRQLAKHIQSLVPREYTAYIEPFVGGAAVLFNLQPKTFVINDLNSQIVDMYLTIKDSVEDLIAELKTYNYNPEFFYRIRAMDRSPKFDSVSKVTKAARLIYLNKTCFNGLYRVNSKGYFNVPFGSYKNPDFVNEKSLRAVSHYFNQSNCTILNGDFDEALNLADENTFVYLDPPYDPLSPTANFTSYTSERFGKLHQARLKLSCDQLHDKGAKFLLSNSSTEFIHKLYGRYNIEIVKATRSINSSGSDRGSIDEVLIKNY